ncbi:MAG: ATP-binding protein [Clostridia bacterium]
MYREKIEELIQWKNSKDRMPLIIRGARQVGKTWLMKEFGKTQYKQYAYINFDNNERMNKLFDGNYDIARIIQGLKIETSIDIEPENTLIIFDEVQEIPKALSSLKYFCENNREYHIIASISLLGVALHEGTSFPVGKVDFLDLYPLNFKEFAIASGKENLMKLIDKKEYELIKTFKEQYIDMLKEYYYIGGMPSAVNTYIETKSYIQVRNVQLRILESYEQDFSKHAPKEIVPRIKMLWNNIPTQLAKENKKFIYGLIREGARAKDYEHALSWLIDCGLVHKVNRVTKPSIPLVAYQDFEAFKIYFLDVGLLSAMTRIDVKTILEGSSILTEFKGALTEQFVLTELISNKDIPVFYWSAERATAEVDFLVQIEGKNIPIEVKAEENLRAKSLKIYMEKYDSKVNVRTSMADFKEQDSLFNIPLYAVHNIQNILDNM